YGSFPGLETTQHYIIKNSIKGIGLSISDRSSVYGSNGILKGINWINMPLSGPTDIETLAKVLGILEIHELGHQWCCYVGDAFVSGLNNPRLEIIDRTNHYYPGLNAPWKEPDGAQEWLSNNDGTFREKTYPQDNLIVPKYHPFTFYFMGLLSESDYDRKYNLYDATNPSSAVPYKEISVRDIINVAGNRELLEPIRIIYPNGGENLIRGNSYEIRWTRNTLNTVTILLQNADTGQIVARLFEPTSNDGSETWTIPTNIATNNNYKIFISYDNFRAFDTSDNTFRIN
ncbi:hypothetical protein HYX19_02005, partial [Candidatus Woesearchaeota archaeon]|nr:hypothetical protein [Candidatus Woesearchaeota archaeon]